MSSPINNRDRLDKLRSLCLLDTDTEPAFDRLSRLASKILKTPIALVSLVDENRQFFKSSIGLPEPWSTLRETPLSHAFCKHVVEKGEPLIIADSRLNPLVQDNPGIEELGIIAYAGFPITTSDGFELGSFCVIDSEPRQWTDDELGILEDLTASVITEIELRNELHEHKLFEAKLAESENRYRVLSELMSDYAFSGRFNENDELENEWITGQAFERVTGYTLGEATTRPDIPSQLVNYLEQTKADVHQVRTGESTSNQYCIKTKQNETRWLQVDHHPKWNETKDKVIGFYGIAHDVTESKRVQERELQLIAEAERNRVLQQCVDNISHDFRTPLSILHTSLYLLKHNRSGDTDNRLAVMQKQVDRLSQLMDNMLLMSRLDNSSQWTFRSINVNEIVTLAATQASDQASKKEIELVSYLDESLHPVNADVNHLHLAIKHLIENAIQFTPLKGQIILRTYNVANEIICEVEDNGIGIHENDLPHIFERFFRADDTRSVTSGGGIGLAIANRVMTAHSGSIEVESIVNQGSTFRLRLPTVKIIDK